MRQRISGRTVAAVAAAIVMTGTAVAGVSVASAASAAPAPGPYTVVNNSSGLCLTVPGGGSADGLQLTQSGCGGAAQTFDVVADGGGYLLKPAHSGKCAGVKDAGTGAGKAVQQESCSGAASQRWSLTESGSTYRVVNANGGKCLNIKDNSTSAGALAQTNSCDSVATKQWRLVPTGSGPTDPPTDPPGDPTGLVGWATQGGGTSGGGNASPVTVSSASALTSALSGTNAAVVRVSGTISCSGLIRVGSNKTLLGNAGATISGCGLNISEASNVIVRNLNFRGWDDDAINVQYSTRVWIDHNSFSDGYDGTVDVKRASDYVTISWNRVFDHDKTMLLGHDDDNGSEDRGHLRVTYHHNWFDGTNQRHPRVRFGNPVHVYNNLYSSVGGYGVASTEGAGVLVEGNYFENTEDPFHLGEGDSGPGSLVARANHFVNSGSGETGGSVASIPYSYSLDGASSVKSIVTAGAGAGRISV
ncbi:RICIN domain-containing protein [Nonomuraea sp. NPDC049714]|uniref:RICIN domain-containing protein n=1 Tax=Nonomuraea sp. NPDC049714 TaxID=3364357 RepID=UPI0037ACE4B1